MRMAITKPLLPPGFFCHLRYLACVLTGSSWAVHVGGHKLGKAANGPPRGLKRVTPQLTQTT